MTYSTTISTITAFVVAALAIAVASPSMTHAQSYYYDQGNPYYLPLGDQNQYQYQYGNQYMYPYPYTGTPLYTMGNQMTAAQRQNLQDQINKLLAQISQLQTQLNAQGTNTYYTYPPYNYNYNYNYGYNYQYTNAQVNVTTNGATNISNYQARLNGDVSFNGANYVTVWFEWGTNRNSLNRSTSHYRMSYRNNASFSALVSNLNRNSTYYFRAVAQDDSGRMDYGSTRSFSTSGSGSSSYYNEPDVNMGSISNITSSAARFSGDVDMNDYNNGIVFFVYGQDRSQVENIESDYNTYSSISTDGDYLQKVRVDTNLDYSKNYYANVYGLENNSRYYVNLCVQYEDRYNDNTIMCGNSDDFTTD